MNKQDDAYDKALKIPMKAPLNAADSEGKTYGCRCVNPDICARAYIPEVCAFARADHICLKPSNNWPKVYRSLAEGGKDEG